jgi:hypothetical protein
LRELEVRKIGTEDASCKTDGRARPDIARHRYAPTRSRRAILPQRSCHLGVRGLQVQARADDADTRQDSVGVEIRSRYRNSKAARCPRRRSRLPRYRSPPTQKTATRAGRGSILNHFDSKDLCWRRVRGSEWTDVAAVSDLVHDSNSVWNFFS